MKPVRELLDKQDVHFVHRTDSVLEAARCMTEWNIGAVTVLEGEQLVGILSERDVMMRVVSEGRSPDRTLVEQVMTQNPVVVDSHATPEQCLRIMNQAKCRHLPVVTDGKLVGMISMRDLLLDDIRQKDQEIELMRAFIHYVPPSAPGGH